MLALSACPRGVGVLCDVRNPLVVSACTSEARLVCGEAMEAEELPQAGSWLVENCSAAGEKCATLSTFHCVCVCAGVRGMCPEVRAALGDAGATPARRAALDCAGMRSALRRGAGAAGDAVLRCGLAIWACGDTEGAWRVALLASAPAPPSRSDCSICSTSCESCELFSVVSSDCARFARSTEVGESGRMVRKCSARSVGKLSPRARAFEAAMLARVPGTRWNAELAPDPGDGSRSRPMVRDGVELENTSSARSGSPTARPVRPERRFARACDSGL